MRTIAVVAYFLTAGACILVGLTAKNNAKRAAPMLVLLLLRFFVVLARLLLNSGSWWASINFLWMEVCCLNAPLRRLYHHVSLLAFTMCHYFLALGDVCAASAEPYSVPLCSCPPAAEQYVLLIN